MLTSEVRPAEARFELTLAFHCAPALAGIKPADLIALPGFREDDIQYRSEVRLLRIQLLWGGIV